MRKNNSTYKKFGWTPIHYKNYGSNREYSRTWKVATKCWWDWSIKPIVTKDITCGEFKYNRLMSPFVYTISSDRPNPKFYHIWRPTIKD